MMPSNPRDHDTEENNRKCDLCRSTKKRVIYNFKNWTLMECTQCGLRWGEYKSHSKGILDLYEREYFNSQNANSIGYSNYSNERQLKQRTFGSWFDKIEVFQHPGAYLDVGCAFGFSLEVARKRGWYPEGVDISAHACNIASNLGFCQVTNKDFLSFEPNRVYDLVTAWDVIEHTASPKLFVNKINNCLKVGGIMAITTPDSNSLGARLRCQNWFEYKWPEHLYYLNRRTLESYIKMSGFEILIMKNAIKYKTFADAVARWTGAYESKNFPLKALGGKIIPYSSFSELFIIARKME